MFGPEKYSKTWEQYSPATLYHSKGLWNFPWWFQRFGDFLGSWRIFVLDTPLKLPYLDTQGSRLISCLTVRDMAGQLTCVKVKAIYLIRKDMCFWRSRLVTWPPWLQTLSHLFWSHFSMKQHQICTSLVQACYISKFIQKVKRKCAGNQEKQCLQWAQVRKFYLIVKVGYYPWLSLACASV